MFWYHFLHYQYQEPYFIIYQYQEPYFITSIKNATSNFNIDCHVSFSNSSTWSNGQKLSHNPSFNNKQCHFYFNHICKLWNSLPIINQQSLSKIKLNHFSGNILLLTLIQQTPINFISSVRAVYYINHFSMNSNHV